MKATAEYTCTESGYTLKEGNTEVASCPDVVCSTAPSVVDGASTNCQNKKYGETCTVSCGANYQDASASYTCDADGNYVTGQALTQCTLKTCAPFSGSQGASGCDASISVGESCQVSCGADYSGTSVTYTWYELFFFSFSSFPSIYVSRFFVSKS